MDFRNSIFAGILGLIFIIDENITPQSWLEIHNFDFFQSFKPILRRCFFENSEDEKKKLHFWNQVRLHIVNMKEVGKTEKS